MRKCPLCLSNVVHEAVYCPSCGTRLAEPTVESLYRCWIHTNRFAPYQCATCGRFICKECRRRHAGRDICKVCYISVLLPKLYMNSFLHSIGAQGEHVVGEVKAGPEARLERLQDVYARGAHKA